MEKYSYKNTSNTLNLNDEYKSTKPVNNSLLSVHKLCLRVKLKLANRHLIGPSIRGLLLQP
jgi:hypothetical protein